MQLRSFFDRDGHHWEILYSWTPPTCSPKRDLDAKLFCKPANVHIRIGGTDRPVFDILFIYKV